MRHLKDICSHAVYRHTLTAGYNIPEVPCMLYGMLFTHSAWTKKLGVGVDKSWSVPYKDEKVHAIAVGHPVYLPM